METGSALLFATIVLIVLILSAAYAWYNFTGWTAFSYKTGDSPSWIPAKSEDISRLRFKDCVFTVTRTDGKVATLDADPVLNSMAVAYKSGSINTNPATLTLTRPLNPFSFVITGFNDKASVPDPTVSPWCTAPPAACTKDSDCPYGTPGSCVPQPVVPPATTALSACSTCPGGATVTLTGKVRTI
jgi:hypothetical protein